jgi:hypothetical protein
MKKKLLLVGVIAVAVVVVVGISPRVSKTAVATQVSLDAARLAELRLRLDSLQPVREELEKRSGMWTAEYKAFQSEQLVPVIAEMREIYDHRPEWNPWRRPPTGVPVRDR